MYLEDFFDYKNELMKTLCSSAEVAELVLDQSSVTVPAKSMAYSCIFPYQYVPETVDQGKTFICFDVDIVEVPNKTVYIPSLEIWEFTHKSKLRLEKGGVRTDVLASEIDKLLNGSRMFGLGELDLYSVQRFSPITDYLGRQLTYYTRDFNRKSGGMSAPSNRKR